MNTITRVAKYATLLAILGWIGPWVFCTKIEPGEVGVRQSGLSGVHDADLAAGWHWRVPGIHKVIRLPAHYLFLDYINDEDTSTSALQIRTKDNNIVLLDVSVPVRIKTGEAYQLVEAGNHQLDANGKHRFRRLAHETSVSVLREKLAELTSDGFYSTDRRLEVSQNTLAELNKSLEPLHLEAKAVLIRAVQFRPEYENQLQQIQLNEQNKLLDRASERVANEQQKLDNFVQGTKALASAKKQDWVKRQAQLERAYEVGFVLSSADVTPGAARRALAELGEAKRAELDKEAREVFGIGEDRELPPHYLLGIRNIAAETLEYKKRVFAEAEGLSARLSAEGDAEVAKVRGDYESKLNALMGSPAGRAYVAWKAAANVKFAEELTFNSRDGIPPVLQLRRFALQFMGR